MEILNDSYHVSPVKPQTGNIDMGAGTGPRCSRMIRALTVISAPGTTLRNSLQRLD